LRSGQIADEKSHMGLVRPEIMGSGESPAIQLGEARRSKKKSERKLQKKVKELGKRGKKTGVQD